MFISGIVGAYSYGVTASGGADSGKNDCREDLIVKEYLHFCASPLVINSILVSVSDMRLARWAFLR